MIKEEINMTKRTHHVVHNQLSGWDIKKGGAKRSSGHYDRKKDAINKAREISRNQNSELVIHNQDGKISRKDSHSNDPCLPKDKK